ncbi:MAG: HD domain-containing protein [Chloroflexi bacterium]|nr:HD domain-containing protein [Chloroflexota bacterium]
MIWQLPARHNGKLQALMERISADAELIQLYKCANINAVDRSGMNDHGEVHIRIVANAALRILRLLVSGGIEPSVVINHGLGIDDAEVIVVLAACLHDIGMAVHREDHEQFSLILGYPKARQLLASIYEEPILTTVVSEVLHAVIAHQADVRAFTIEAGVVKVADALDMSQGRSRIPFEAGKINIHSVSALAVEAVNIEPGEKRPVRISIRLNNSAGIFQIDELLRRKLSTSLLSPYVEVVARIEGETEPRLFETYALEPEGSR